MKTISLAVTDSLNLIARKISLTLTNKPTTKKSMIGESSSTMKKVFIFLSRSYPHQMETKKIRNGCWIKPHDSRIIVKKAKIRKVKKT